MFHQDRLLLCVAISNVVVLFFAGLASRYQRALLYLDADQFLAALSVLRLDFDLEIERIANEALLPWGQIFNASVTRVGPAVENGDRSLHPMKRRAVFYPESV